MTPRREPWPRIDRIAAAAQLNIQRRAAGAIRCSRAGRSAAEQPHRLARQDLVPGRDVQAVQPAQDEMVAVAAIHNQQSSVRTERRGEGHPAGAGADHAGAGRGEEGEPARRPALPLGPEIA